MPISTSDLSTICDYSSPFTAPHISSKQIFVFSLTSATTLPAALGKVQFFFILTVDPFYIPLLSFNLSMPQLPLLCLHQREGCLLAECVSPALDFAHCYRDHRDRFSPDVKQCVCWSEYTIMSHRESGERCSLLSNVRVGDWSETDTC